MTFTQSTFPESKSSHLKRWHPKRKSSLRNQQFSACHVFGECTLVYCLSPPPTKKRETLVAEGAEVLSRLIKLIPKIIPFGKEIHFPRPVIFGIHSLTFGGLISIQYTSSCMGGKNIYQDPEPFNKWSSTCGEKKTPKNLQLNLNSPIHLFPSLLLSGGSSSINLEWGIWPQIGSSTHVVRITWSLSFKKPL